jgi:hypothetical protein
MKRLLLTLALLLLCGAEARAIDVTVTGLNISGYSATGTTAHVRAYYSTTIVASDGTTIPGDVSGGANFYSRVNCTVNTSTRVATCPSFTLKSTTDSSVPTARVTLALYNSANSKIKDLYVWRVPHTLGAAASVQQLVTYNQSAPAPLGDTYYTAAQVNTLIASVGSGGGATTAYTAVACGASPVLDIGAYSRFDLTLSCNVGTPTLSGAAAAGRQITVSVKQDATGNRTFTWPATFQEAPAVERRALGATTATFQYDGANWRLVSQSTQAEGGYALYCDGNSNVHHGNYYPSGAALGNQFYYDFIIRPDSDANGYVISDGFGGGHAMLVGPTCGSGSCGITGNIWNVVGASLTTFNSVDSFPSDVWTHIAVIGYGSDVRVYINGVPSNITSFPGTRGSPGGGAGSGNLYVCGSDHSMYKGHIASLRAFEGWAPLQYASSAFVPAERLTCQLREAGAASMDTYREANLCVDYTVPGAMIADLGSGYYGRKHVGVPFNNASGQPAGNTGEEPSAYPRSSWRYDPTMPFNRQGTAPFRPSFAATPGAVPSGAEIFDSFNRQDTNYWLGGTPSIGSTEGGSLGPLAWNSGNSAFGIVSGRAYMAAAPTVAWATVPLSQANHSAEVTVERVGTGKNGVIWRGESDDDFLYAGYEFAGGADKVLIARFTGGVLTAIIAEPNAAPTWTSIKGQCVGTACAVYLDGSGTPLHSWTEPTLLTGTRVGIAAYQGNSFARWNNFTAYHL